MKTFPESLSTNYADWSAVGWAMLLGHAPASPGRKPNGELAPRSAEQDWEGEGGSLKAPAKKRPAMKAKAKKRPAMKAKAKRRR